MSEEMTATEINELVYALCKVAGDRLPADLRRKLTVADMRELVEKLINKPEQVIKPKAQLWTRN